MKNIEQWGPIDGRILYPSFWYRPSAEFRYWPDMIGFFEDHRMTFFWKHDSLQKSGVQALKKWILGPKQRQKTWKEYEKVVRELKSIAAKHPIPAGKWYDALKRFWKLVLIPETANFGAPDYLRAQLTKFVPPEHMDRALEALLAPEKLSFHQLSEYDLLRVKDLSSVARKWYWVENSYYESKVLTAADFARMRSKLSAKQRTRKIKAIADYLGQVRGRKRQIAREFRLPRKLVSDAAAMAFCIWWQDHRKGVIWWTNSVTDRISRQVGKRLGRRFDDILDYTAEEWGELVRRGTKVLPVVLRKRKGPVAFEFRGRDFRILYGDSARRAWRKWTGKRDRGDNELLQGTTVSRGKSKVVSGRVCVLRSPRNLSKMKKGDILVAAMTSPDFITAMRRAKAIITDVGGLMSHAAVVSRELGVPCIVGTRFATKVLKDGDMVEMDTEKGIVRKIKKS